MNFDIAPNFNVIYTIIDNNSDQASEITLTNGNDHSTPKAEGNEGGLPLSQLRSPRPWV